jgi:large repetitive protein
MAKFGRRWAGVVTSIWLSVLAVDALAQSQTSVLYQYDERGRLRSAENTSGKTVVYDYDDAGNRTSVGTGRAATASEIKPQGFSASSNGGNASNGGVFSGLTAADGMRDIQYGAITTTHVTGAAGDQWIEADLGAGQFVDHLDLAAPTPGVAGGGTGALNGAVVRYSLNGSDWIQGPTISGVALSAYRSVMLRAQARFVRLTRSNGAVGVGDFRLYGTADVVNRSPKPTDDNLVATAGKAEPFDPRINDGDDDGDPLTIVGVTGWRNATSVTTNGQAISYTGASAGDDQFTYTIKDPSGATADAVVRVVVKAASSGNHDPIVKQEFGTGTEKDIPVRVVLGSAYLYDEDGDALSFESTPTASAGSVTPVPGQMAFDYSPPSGQTGTFYINYVVKDGKGGRAPGSGIIRVTASLGANTQPTAMDDPTWSAMAGEIVTDDPRGNDINNDGDLLSITNVVVLSGGGTAFVVQPDRAKISYSAPNPFTGPATLRYTIDDGRGQSSSAVITIRPRAAMNKKPEVSTINVSTFAGTVVQVPIADYVSDPDGDSVSLTNVTAGHLGATVNWPTLKIFNYFPAPLPNGVNSVTDSLQYSVEDGHGGTNEGTVNVTIYRAANRWPTADNHEYTIPRCKVADCVGFTFSPLPFAQDPDGDPVRFQYAFLDDKIENNSNRGTLVQQVGNVANDGKTSPYVTFTPKVDNSDYDVVIAYVVGDSHGFDSYHFVETWPTCFQRHASLSPSVGCVTLHVRDVAAATPVAQSGSMRVASGGKSSTYVPVEGLYNDIVVTQQSSKGSAFFSGTLATFESGSGQTGTSSFRYKARGPAGVGPEAVMAVAIGQPDPPNQPPLLLDDPQGNVPNRGSQTFAVLGNDKDPDTGDNSTLTIASTLVRAPSKGIATVQAGRTIKYTPFAGALGPDSLVYTASDNRGASPQATVSLTLITPPNVAPILNNDGPDIAEKGVPTAIYVLKNDTDEDGDTLTVQSAVGAANGTAVPNGNTVTYTANPNTTQTSDQFTYTVSDGNNHTLSAIAKISIVPKANTAPSDTV